MSLYGVGITRVSNLVQASARTCSRATQTPSYRCNKGSNTRMSKRSRTRAVRHRLRDACTNTIFSMAKWNGNQKPFVCQLCLRSFSTRSLLTSHLECVHDGEGKYVCAVCEKEFVYKDSLERHEQLHSNDSRYTCQRCGRTFRDHTNLCAHVLVDGGDRPYACTRCGSTFSALTSLKQHTVSVHTKDFEFPCHLCGEGFSFPRALKRHLQRKHAGAVCKE
ncbi:oocyte zinc finger protein XlCOF15-like [Ornithodoros turicata]|uniref:oocyte zinc finger protein XlCOF15-like n=1 Tax=Ornithodoros turicata TaxID=34597 RepID=UPI00313A0FC1